MMALDKRTSLKALIGPAKCTLIVDAGKSMNAIRLPLRPRVGLGGYDPRRSGNHSLYRGQRNRRQRSTKPSSSGPDMGMDFPSTCTEREFASGAQTLNTCIAQLSSLTSSATGKRRRRFCMGTRPPFRCLIGEQDSSSAPRADQRLCSTSSRQASNTILERLLRDFRLADNPWHDPSFFLQSQAE